MQNRRPLQRMRQVRGFGGLGFRVSVQGFGLGFRVLRLPFGVSV